MNKEQKLIIYRLIIAALFAAAAYFFDFSKNIELGLILAAYIVAGYSVFIECAYGLYNRQLLDENFLMTIATIGAMVLGQYEEALGVMVFYLIGQFFEGYAVNKSRKSISDAMDIRPDFARLIRDNTETVVDPYEVNIGDIISVRPGEKIPLDGLVVKGSSELDTSPLTGESMLREVSQGGEVLSGCLNTSGLLEIEVKTEFHDSTVSKILELVENSGAKKAKTERFITKFAKVYTPAVVGAAILLAFLPPLILSQSFATWIYRALLFLVISCPCALVISVPLSFFGGIGAAGSLGVLVKGGSFIETFANTKTIVFDKTGTLTHGRFQVVEIAPIGCTKQELLTLAAHVEYNSNHPLASAITEYYIQKVKDENSKTSPYIDTSIVSKFEEIPGMGSSAVISEKLICVGNSKLMEFLSISDFPQVEGLTLVHVAYDKQYLGYIALADSPKKEALGLVKALKDVGIERTVMLTGDNKLVADRVGEIIGIDEIHSELLPENKVKITEEIMKDNGQNEYLAFVGDGINDAPVLAMADIGVAMGGLGSDAAVEAADVVILDDNIEKLVSLKKISKKTIAIAKQNIIFAITVKFAVLILGALGFANMWMAIFADVGVSVLAISNAMRAVFLAKKFSHSQKTD